MEPVRVPKGSRHPVSISGNYAVASANQANKAYVFERNFLGVWNEVQKIVAIPDGQPIGSDFGRSVSISGDYIIVGAREEREDASGLNTIGIDYQASFQVLKAQ